MSVFSTPRGLFHKKFAYTFEIPGFGSAAFEKVGPLKVQVAKIQHWEGGALAPEQEPGRVTTPDVVCERGVTSDLDMWTWMQQAIDASAMVEEPNHQRLPAIVQRDRRGTELKRWTLVSAWPTEYEGGDWDNGVDEVTVEKLTLAVKYWTLGGDRQP